MENLSTKLEYKPLVVSRRSEIVSWALTVILLFVLLVSSIEGRGKFGGMVLFVFLILSSLTMTVGNWIDRKTYLRLGELEVEYYNGAREVSISWHEIDKVEIFQGKFGDKIIVSSPESGFRFQALGKIAMTEKVSGQVGFEQGVQILEIILKRSGLDKFKRHGADRSEYYSRE